MSWPGRLREEPPLSPASYKRIDKRESFQLIKGTVSGIYFFFFLSTEGPFLSWMIEFPNSHEIKLNSASSGDWLVTTPTFPDSN